MDTAAAQRRALWPTAAMLDGRTLRRLLVWYLTSRAVICTSVLAAWTLRPELSWVSLLRRLDAAWYLDVAVLGYADQPATAEVVATDAGVLRSAFFPLWPLLARVTRPPGVPIEVSATVVAAGIGFAAWSGPGSWWRG